MQENIKIVKATSEALQYVQPIVQLLRQLSSTPVEFNEETYKALTLSSSSNLYLLLCDDKVCGMLTLAHYLAPTGRKLWIEDVVVDSAMRGHSLGRMLVEHAIAEARTMGGTLMLTSKPARVAANALYRSAGFEPKETNVYKMNLKKYKE